MNPLAAFLKERLKGQKQSWICSKTGLKPAYLSRILSGGRKPTTDQVCILAAHIGESPYTLFEIAGDITRAALFKRLAFPSGAACSSASDQVAGRLRRLFLRGYREEFESRIEYWENLWSIHDDQIDRLVTESGAKRACLLGSYGEVQADVFYRHGMLEEEAEYLGQRLPLEGWEVVEVRNKEFGLTLRLAFESPASLDKAKARANLLVWAAAYSLLLRLP